MLRLSEIMTRDVVSVTPETTLRDAVELFADRHISGAPVMSGPALVGVVSAADIISFAASMRGAPIERDDAAEWSEWSDPGTGDEPETENVAPGTYFTDLFCDGSADVVERMRTPNGDWGMFEEHTVDDVMTRGAVTLAPGAGVLEAAELMQRRSIHRVLVVEGGRVVGIVSALDVARAVANHKLT